MDCSSLTQTSLDTDLKLAIFHSLPDEETGPSLCVPVAFSAYIGQTLNDSEKLAALESHFTQDKLYHFPKCKEYGKQRAFNCLA